MRWMIAVFKIRWRQMVNYRVAALAGVGTQLFFGFVMVMIYDRFFQSTQSVMPMTFTQTVTYIWLGQGLLGLLPWNGDREIQGMIRTGDFVYELIRPINLYFYWYAKIMAQRLGGTLLRAIPLFLVVNLMLPRYYKMTLSAGFPAFIMFLCSMCIAVLLGAAISNLITLSVLFTIGDGIDRLLPAIVTFFSGMVIPLSFFPEWSQTLFKLLPFSGLLDTPYKFYLGIYTVHDFFKFAVLQGSWVVILIAAGNGLVYFASRRTVVQGG